MGEQVRLQMSALSGGEVAVGAVEGFDAFVLVHVRVEELLLIGAVIA